MTLCVRHHNLLPGLMSAYAIAPPSVQVCEVLEVVSE